MEQLTGSLRRQIFLRKRADTVDASGSRVPTWTRLGPIFAAVDTKSTGSGELHTAGQSTARARTIFRIRKSPDRSVLPTDEIEYNGVRYEIDTVSEAGTQYEFLELECLLFGYYRKSPE